MTKPDVTLQPSKGVVTQAAAQIYAAYVAQGFLENGDSVDDLIKRSIREAVTIARTVDSSVQSDNELPVAGDSTAAPSPLEQQT